MSSRALHALRLFLVPGAPIAAAAILLGAYAGTSEAVGFAAAVVLLAAVGAGLVLAWRFNQSRTAFALLLILCVDRFWVHAFSGGGFWTQAAAIAAVSTLPPLNFLAMSVSRERGVLTRFGLLRLGALAAEAGAIAVVLWQMPRLLYQYVAVDVVPTRFFEWTRMPQPALLVFLLAMAAFLIAYLRHRRAEDAGFFWATITLTMPVLLPAAPRVFTIYAAGAALILLSYVLESSHSMAFRDTLTGLPGRRAFENELAKLGSRYAIAIADIDYFKTFNDTYGHDVGDQVLRMVAGHLARVGGGGRAFRYGGEEFTILFPRRSPADVEAVLEELRKRIDEARFTLRRRDRPETPPPKEARGGPRRRQTPLSVTVSLGIAGRNGAKRSPQEVLKAADEALYSAKRNGRNRIASA
ncbi:MAG: diguanylate cyclase [Spirochaetes bacterium]|nr:diguanylate cyclase [Spirochaetota bacterium]